MRLFHRWNDISSDLQRGNRCHYNQYFFHAFECIIYYCIPKALLHCKAERSSDMWELLYINDRSIQSTRFFDVPLPVCTFRDPGRGRDRGGFRQDPGSWDTNTRSGEHPSWISPTQSVSPPLSGWPVLFQNTAPLKHHIVSNKDHTTESARGSGALKLGKHSSFNNKSPRHKGRSLPLALAAR